MNLEDLQFCAGHELPATTVIFRTQRTRARPGTLNFGGIKLPPAGLLLNRFDLPDSAVGYFAETQETCVYESLARRESNALALSKVATMQILSVQLTESLVLADLRPHAPSWPVLQSLRIAHTQQLAASVRDAGFDGVIYRSAQQFGHDCMAVFGGSLSALKVTRRANLVSKDGRLHRAMATAIRGSQIPLHA